MSIYDKITITSFILVPILIGYCNLTGSEGDITGAIVGFYIMAFMANLFVWSLLRIWL